MRSKNRKLSKKNRKLSKKNRKLSKKNRKLSKKNRKLSKNRKLKGGAMNFWKNMEKKTLLNLKDQSPVVHHNQARKSTTLPSETSPKSTSLHSATLHKPTKQPSAALHKSTSPKSTSLHSVTSPNPTTLPSVTSLHSVTSPNSTTISDFKYGDITIPYISILFRNDDDHDKLLMIKYIKKNSVLYKLDPPIFISNKSQSDTKLRSSPQIFYQNIIYLGQDFGTNSLMSLINKSDELDPKPLLSNLICKSILLETNEPENIKKWTPQEGGWLLYWESWFSNLKENPKLRSELLDSLNTHYSVKLPDNVALPIEPCTITGKDMFRDESFNGDYNITSVTH